MEERIVDTGVRPLDFLGPCLPCKSGCTDEIIRLVYKFGQGFFIEDKSVATNAMPETILHGIDADTNFASGTLSERMNNFPALEIRGSVDPEDIVTIAVSRKVGIGDIRVGYTDANTSMTVSSSAGFMSITRRLDPPGDFAELSKRNRDYWYEHFTGDLRPDAKHFRQSAELLMGEENDEIADEWLERMYTWVYKRVTNTDHVDYYEGCGQTRNYATNDAVVGIWDFNLADSYTIIEELEVYAKQEVIATFPVCGELEVQRAPAATGEYYEVENPDSSGGDFAVSGSQSESRKQEVVHFLLKSDCPDPSISNSSEHPHKFGVSYGAFTGINGRHFDNNEEKKNIGMMRKTYLVKVGKVFKTTVVSPGTHPFQRATSSGGDVYYTIVDPVSTNPASKSGDWLDTRPKPQNQWGGWSMGVPYMGAGSAGSQGSQQATPEVPKPFANYLLQFPFTPMEHKDRITSVQLRGPYGNPVGPPPPPLPKLGEGPVSGQPRASSLRGGSFKVFDNAFDDDFSDVQKKNIYDNITDALADFKTTAYRTVSKYTGGTGVHGILDPDGNPAAGNLFSKYLEGRMNVSCDSAIYMSFGTNSYTEATKGSKKFRQSYPDFLNHSGETKKGVPINGRSFIPGISQLSEGIVAGGGLNSTIDLNGESSHAELISNANDDVLVLDNDRYFGDNSYVPTTTTVTTSSALGMGTMGGWGSGGMTIQAAPQEAFLAAVTFYTAPLSHYSEDNGAEDSDVYELDFTEIHQEVFDVAIAGGVPDDFAVGGFNFSTGISGLEECIKAWTSVDPSWTGNIKIDAYADDIWRSNLPEYAYDIACEPGEDYVNEVISGNFGAQRRGIPYTGESNFGTGFDQTPRAILQRDDGSIVAGDKDKVLEPTFQNEFVPVPKAFPYLLAGCATKDPLPDESLVATETGEARIICTDYYPPRFDEGQRVLDDCNVKFDGVGIHYQDGEGYNSSAIYDDEGNQCINISHIETFKIRFLDKRMPTKRSLFGYGFEPAPELLTDDDFTDPVMHICGQGSFDCNGKWSSLQNLWGRSTGEEYIYDRGSVTIMGIPQPPAPPILGGPIGYSCSNCWKSSCVNSESISNFSVVRCKGCNPEMSRQDGSGYNRVCRDEPLFPGSDITTRICDPIPDDIVATGELWRPAHKGYLWYTYIGLYPVQAYIRKGESGLFDGRQPPLIPGDPYYDGQRRDGSDFDRDDGSITTGVYNQMTGTYSQGNSIASLNRRNVFTGTRIYYPQPTVTEIKFKLGLNEQSLDIGEIPIKITLGRGEQ